MDKKNKVLAVVGPTASGKTALSVALARVLDGEIISCDSMQIYKEMDIGTAKATYDEMQGIRHHLLSFVSPRESFSCSDYAEAARQKIEEISSRGKIPIFCGGTGLYLDSVLAENEFSEAGQDPDYRKELSEKSADELYEMLMKTDIEAAEKTHKNNVKRVIRALEIYHLTGITKSEWDKKSRTKESPYDAVIIGLDFKNRDKLYERINRRVDIMLEGGLVDEVKALDSPAFRASTASQGIGYKEILDYIDGKTSLSEASELIKKNSRNYAKRQLTWFRRNKDVLWIYVDECGERSQKGVGAQKTKSLAAEVYAGDFKFIVNSALNIINNK